MSQSTRAATILAVVWVVFVSAVYLPDLGRGFVKDDFAWINASRDALAQPTPNTPPRDIAAHYRLIKGSVRRD